MQNTLLRPPLRSLAPLTTADLVGVLLAGLSVGRAARLGRSRRLPPRGPRPAARARHPGRHHRRGARARLAHLPRVELRRAAARAAAELGRRGDPDHGRRAAARLRRPRRRARRAGASRCPGTRRARRARAAVAAIGDERSWQRRVRALEAIAAAFPSDCEGVLIAVGRSVRPRAVPERLAALAGARRAAAGGGVRGPVVDGPRRRWTARTPSGSCARWRASPGRGASPWGWVSRPGRSGPGLSAGALFLGGALVHLSAASGGAAPARGPDRRVLDTGGRAVGVSRLAMKTVRLRPRLGILFVLAVGLPSAALVVIAVRSISGEEAILEKRLERTLVAELDHVVTLVADAMQDVREELARAAPAGHRERAARPPSRRGRPRRTSWACRSCSRPTTGWWSRHGPGT